MANPEHLEILGQGVEVWNKWREENPHIRPDLSHANQSDAYLIYADLSGVRLSRASLMGADWACGTKCGTKLKKPLSRLS